MSDRHRRPDAGMLRATTPLRVRRDMHALHSDEVAAVIERVRVDLARRRGADYANWWAGRLAANPGLLWPYASSGLDPHAEVDDA